METEQDESTTSTAEPVITPARVQTVDFYGDAIPMAQSGDGDLYVPVRPLAEFLGLQFSAQRRRILRDRVLAARVRLVVFTGRDGFRREQLSLPLDMLPGWLFGVTTSKVGPELADKIDRYRAECFQVLWNAFKGETIPAPAPPGKSGAALAVEIAGAVYALAQQQLEIETRLGEVAGRQEVMADYLRGFIQRTEGRLTSLELQLNAGATISEVQAGEIALAVKNVGQALAARGDRQGYAKVYGEMYRRYRISSYKNLPAARYQEVVDWLAGWYGELHSGPNND